MREEDYLKKRSELFLKEAEDDIRKGFFDLAAFHLEQALQLRLKYLLAKKIGYFSKTHRLTALLEEAKHVLPSLETFIKENKEILEDLEIAYIGARYLPITYSKKRVEKYMQIVKKMLEVLSRHEGH